MLTQQRLLDLGLASDLDSLQRQLDSAVEALGFGLWSAVLIRGRLESSSVWGVSIGNAPAGYAEAQSNRDEAIRDPVLAALRASTRPVTYDQALYVTAGAGDLWDAQAPFGYRSGVACTVHEPSHAEQFMLGVDTPDALPSDPVSAMRITADVQLLTVFTQSAMQRLLTPAPAGELAAVNASELEALRWARNGYAVWQVGDRLSISDAEVLRRQNSAAKKLGTRTIEGAVLRCIQGGLIG